MWQKYTLGAALVKIGEGQTSLEFCWQPLCLAEGCVQDNLQTKLYPSKWQVEN